MISVCAMLLYFHSITATAGSSLDFGDLRNWKHTSSDSSQEKPKWGTWKPGQYFGVRSRQFPAFVSTGMMWTRPGSSLIRHNAKQDEITKFEWLRHDGTTYGKHDAVDRKLKSRILSTFVAPVDDPTVSWVQRFDISTTKAPLSFFFYFGTDCDGNLPDKECLLANPTELFAVEEVIGHAESGPQPSQSLIVRGRSVLSGLFEVQFNLFSKGDDRMTYWSPLKKTVPYITGKILEHAGKAGSRTSKKDTVFRNDSSTSFLNRWSHNTSAFATQLSVTSDARLEVILRENIDEGSDDSVQNTNIVTSDSVLSWITEREHNFDKMFMDSYGANLQDEELSEISKRVVSAVLGGIGLFNGHPHIGNATSHPERSSGRADIDRSSAPIELYSGTPSRTSFPRGFLWDEGFHLMVSSQWSLKLGVDIVSSWMEAMFTLPELILGRDALSVVPEEFVVQRVDIANPPTIMLVIEKMIDSVTRKSSDLKVYAATIRAFLTKQYPALCRWMKWYFITQEGPSDVEGSFRWRGRSSSDGKLHANTLASGLDDYPRAVLPTADEYHVDLYSWMVKFAGVMAKVDNFLGHGDDPARKHFFEDRLDSLHWSDEHSTYADVGLHAEGEIVEEFVYRCVHPHTRDAVDIGLSAEVLFSNRRDFSKSCPTGYTSGFPLGGDNRGYLSRERYQVDEGTEKIQHVSNIGYVSLFPFLLTIVPPGSTKLDHILDIIENELLTDYGLRSLATSNQFYGMSNSPGDNPYWRGYIWLNINYLAVTALKHYEMHAARESTRNRCSELYSSLRESLISNVLSEYRRTGYLWEQYDDSSGQGTRGHPFSGWTALIVNIISESYQ
ncbi:unnamed protein product [Ectocarpus fasciculatus]